MATKLTKPVVREMLSGAEMSRGKYANRAILVSLLPGDEVEFRIKGTRQRFSVYLGHCFRLAQILTLESQYKDKVKAYQERKKSGARAIRPRKPMLPFSKVYFDATKNS